MAKKIINIDGPIGNYAFSKQFIRNQLEGHQSDPVLVNVSSLGGDVDHALNIHDQFVKHGNVTCELSGFVASSATFLSLGAKHVRMSKNSFYLIHKAMQWVDEWGTLNEDDITDLIDKLETAKKNVATVTLQIAKMYVAKTGKSLDEIINLMKEEIWLTADEAFDWGFIDAVITPEVVVNHLENSQMVAMVTANGFPSLPRESQTKTTPKNDEDSMFNRLYERLKSSFKNTTEQIPKITIMKKQFDLLNLALDVEKLESVDGHVHLNEQQLEVIDNAIKASEKADQLQNAISEKDTAVTERDAAVTAKATAETDFSNAINLFNAIDNSVAGAETIENKVEAIKALLAKKPGDNASGTQEEVDADLGADSMWNTIDNLPHNQNLDNN